MRFATKTIHAAQPSEPETGALVAPIFQTSTYEQDAPAVNRGFDYSRTNNPTRQRLEDVLAELEGVRYCAAFASGLAAENAILQAYLRPGDEVVVPLDVYGGTFRLLNTVFKPLGCTVKATDLSDAAAVRAAITPRTRLVWIESPTNPRLLVSDIALIAEIAHQHGALVVVDNTFATPCFQRPFELGADLVVHSVTKYLAGHSDLIQGAVLAAHPAVRRVYYPGLPDHPGHAIARRQMSGFGGMVSCELEGTVDDVVAFVSGRRYFALGESLGGVKSLICHPARMTHASIPAEERARLGLSDTLIRLSPGCEHPDDLIEDIVEGLDSLNSELSTRQLSIPGVPA